MKNKNLFYALSRIFLCIWLSSIVFFFFTAFKLNTSKYQGDLLGGSVIFGVVSFIAMITSGFLYMTNKHEKIKSKLKSENVIYNPKNDYRAIKFTILGVIGLFLILGYLNYKQESLVASQKSENQKLIDSQKNIVDYQLFAKINDYRQSEKLTGFNQDDEVCKVANDILVNNFWETNLTINKYKHICSSCSSLSLAESRDNSDIDSVISQWKDNKDTLKTLRSSDKYACVKVQDNKVVFITVSKTIQKTQVVNNDPVIDCVSSAPNCNGSSIKAKRSQCSLITCCQVGNTWSVYATNQKCDEAQNGSQPTQNQKITQPAAGLNFYCYDNINKYSYYTSSGEQCNLDNAKSLCRSIKKTTMYDPCMQKCLNTAKENVNVCITAYSGPNAVMEDNPQLYQECSDQNTKEHQTCMDSCATPYNEALKSCY